MAHAGDPLTAASGPDPGPRAAAPEGAATIEVVRVYDDHGRRRGEHRVLVDRLWPRGIAKAALDADEWARDVAPTSDLRRWYGHVPDRFAEFARRYRLELDEPPAAGALARLAAVVAGGTPLVLLTATRDVDHSGATVLRELLAADGPPSGGG